MEIRNENENENERKNEIPTARIGRTTGAVKTKSLGKEMEKSTY